MARNRERAKIATGELDFSVPGVCREVQEVARLAESFLQPGSARVAEEIGINLRSFARSKRRDKWTWSIAETDPIRTKLTQAYEPEERRGANAVWGELSFTWTIVLVHPEPDAAFSISGNASNKICIKMLEPDGGTVLLAQWQFEIGDAMAPGCHFHVGLCRAGNETPFPHWLTVPRLPSVLIMPVDALDFLLGEIFQKEWKACVSRENDHTRALFASQRDRLTRLLEWKRDEVMKSSGSAWSWLKHRHPDVEMFTRKR
jgi:hypothetical protein